MSDGYLVGDIDVAELALLAFTLFFFALVIYLRREDRREGYPLEHEISGKMESVGGPVLTASPKTFKLPFGKGSVQAPVIRKEATDIAARRVENFAGAPYVPTGDPLVDGVGPAAWAERAEWPDLDGHGNNRIVPAAMAAGVTVARGDADPRGMKVIAADGKIAGTVSELWIDRAEHVVRYLEIDTGAGRAVLAPMPMANVRKSRRVVEIDALPADRFAGVPALAMPGEITRREEERIMAYFGGGYLYGSRDRQEPWL